MWEILLDALIDTAIVLPILLIVNILIEWFEYKASKKVYHSNFLMSKGAPVFAAAVGIIPQCGFSVVATNLFAKKKIAIGTLIAVFIATSDEAIPIFLSNKESAIKLLPLLIGKFVFALTVGLILNLIFNSIDKKKQKSIATDREKNNQSVQTAEKLEINNKNAMPLTEKKIIMAVRVPSESSDINKKTETKLTVDENGKSNLTTENNKIEEECEHGCHGHAIGQDEHKKSDIFIHPLIHTLTVGVYILLANIIFGTIIYFVGTDKIKEFLASAKFFAPFIAALIGLIPNCASSAIIAQSFVAGFLSFGSTFAGLCANAGIALAVLFKQNKNQKQNIFIVVFLYIISSLVGVGIDLIF